MPLILHFLHLKVSLAKWQRKVGPVALLHGILEVRLSWPIHAEEPYVKVGSVALLHGILEAQLAWPIHGGRTKCPAWLGISATATRFMSWSKLTNVAVRDKCPNGRHVGGKEAGTARYWRALCKRHWNLSVRPLFPPTPHILCYFLPNMHA